VIPSPDRPTFYFIGVSTGGSLALTSFPVWLETLGLPAVAIRGHDIPVRGPREAYREIVRHIRGEARALGGLVTTHKLDIVAAARDLFDELDPYAQAFAEVSCISKRGPSLRGSAKDPFSSGRALENFLPPRYWVEHPEAEALILGAGGAGMALGAYLLRGEHGRNVPRRILIADLNPRHLAACRESLGRLGAAAAVHYEPVGEGRSCDRLLAELPAGSLVVNATGLGKDGPGSPLSPEALFPLDGYVWEFNYRGELEFLAQARRQQEARRLTVEDGLTYFVFGWALVIGEVFGRELGPQELGALCRATHAFLGSPPDRRACE